MKNKFNTYRILSAALTLMFFYACKETSEIDLQKNRPYTHHTPTSHHEVAKEVLETSKSWIKSFNEKNFKAIADAYDQNAILRQGQ